MPPATRNARRRPHRRAHVVGPGAANTVVVRDIVHIVDQGLLSGVVLRFIAGCNVRAAA